MKLLIIDYNEQFIRNFQKIIRDKGHNNIILTSYTDVEKYKTDFSRQEESTYDVLMCRDSIYDLIAEQNNAKNVLLLVGSAYNDTYENVNKISAYASASEIINEINLIYASQGNKNYVPDAKQAKLVTFSSLYGGTGQSTLAYLTADAIAKQNKKVLYLPLLADGILSLNKFKYDFTYILTDIRDMNIVSYEIEKIKFNNGILDCLIGFHNPVDFNSEEYEQLEKLFEILKMNSSYDYIVIDGIDTFDLKFKAILKQSDNLQLVTSLGYMESGKFNAKISSFEKYLRQLSLNANYKVLLNAARSPKSQASNLKSEHIYPIIFPYEKGLKRLTETGDLALNNESRLSALLTEFVCNEVIK